MSDVAGGVACVQGGVCGGQRRRHIANGGEVRPEPPICGHIGRTLALFFERANLEIVEKLVIRDL
jgi:hypothetical protein